MACSDGSYHAHSQTRQHSCHRVDDDHVEEGGDHVRRHFTQHPSQEKGRRHIEPPLLLMAIDLAEAEISQGGGMQGCQERRGVSALCSGGKKRVFTLAVALALALILTPTLTPIRLAFLREDEGDVEGSKEDEHELQCDEREPIVGRRLRSHRTEPSLRSHTYISHRTEPSPPVIHI